MPDVLVVDSLMGEDAVDRLLRCWESFPVYTPSGTGSYVKKRTRRRNRTAGQEAEAATRADRPSARFAPGLGQRPDSRSHYLREGGLRYARQDPLLPFRHRYFRETLLEGDQVYAPGIEELLENVRLAEAARSLFDRPVIEPWNVYANVMLPGQELGLHTDTPEFRGAHRRTLPAWFLCAMQLSGLFEEWRVPIATAVVYLQTPSSGGEFVCYPPGRPEPEMFPAARNTALVLDSDSIFHGVHLVPGRSDAIRHIDGNSRLVPSGHGRWSLRCGRPGQLEEVETYSSNELRVSLSWKAYCYADDGERAAHAEPSDALTMDRIIETFVSELVARGRLGSRDHGLSEEELGLSIIESFVHFPDTDAVPGGGSRAS